MTHATYGQDWDHPFPRSADNFGPRSGDMRTARADKVLERVAVPRPIIRHRLGIIELRTECKAGGDRATEDIVHLSRG